MPLQPRMSVVTLGVTDLARSRRFYVDGLGWPVAPASNDDITFLQLRGIVLALFSREALAEDVGVSASGEGFRGVTLAHNVATAEEVAVVLDQAVAAGARLVKPAQQVFWGGTSGYFADPDGHLWEVAHNPFWDLTG